MSISFIAKPIFFKSGIKGGVYPARLSSRVRGEEIAEYLGETYTSDATYDKSGIRIHLKPRHLRYVKDGDYVDVLDEIELIPMLKERPTVKVISMSQTHHNYLRNEIKNEIFLIHHHHINFEKFRRKKNDILTGGMIGHHVNAYDIYDQIKKRLGEVGIEFVSAFNYKIRQDMVDFFKKIDFLVTWWSSYNLTAFRGHPTKIINAASFGIPSLSQFSPGYKEFEGFYIQIGDMDSLVEEAIKLKDADYYNQWSDKVFKEAEKYHISNIAKLYRKLR